MNRRILLAAVTALAVTPATASAASPWTSLGSKVDGRSASGDDTFEKILRTRHAPDRTKLPRSEHCNATDGKPHGQPCVLTLTGPAGIVQPGAVLTVNTFTFSGTVSADGRRIDAVGEGRIAGSFEGYADSCTLRSTSVLTR